MCRTLQGTNGQLRILLVKPDISDVSVGFTSLARVAPLDLLMVAASVPEHECRILDMRLEEDRSFEETLAEFQPHIVGVTAYSAESRAAKRLFARAKKAMPGVITVMGGVHATMATADVLEEPAIDYIVVGEGEETFPELLKTLQNGGDPGRVRGIAFRRGDKVCKTPRRPQIADLDSLPFPDWGLLKRYQEKYYLNVMGVVGSVESSRGCPYDCNFCSVWVFHDRKYRKKSPERVIAELRRLPEVVQVVAFVDDEFWVDTKRALRIADLIAQEPSEWHGHAWKYWAQVRSNDIVRDPELVSRWASVGLKVLLLGIESHKDSELAELHHKRITVNTAITALKTMRQSGVEAWGCFIVNPEWQEEDFVDLIEFVRSNEIAFPQFTVLTPLPGTVLTNRLMETGELEPGKLQFQLLDFLHAAMGTKLPLRNFYELMARLYRETSMGANMAMYKRAVRNGVINRDWLRSPMGRQVTSFLTQLTNVDAYLRAHEFLGQKV